MKHLLFSMMLLAVSAATQAREWSSYTSENFTIYSDVKPKVAHELLEEFETFRQVAFLAVGIKPQPSHEKMKIMVYAKGREYRAIGPKNSLGFFGNTAAGPRMVIGPSSRSISSSEVLYHEYMHYLLRQHSTFVYPRWYEEGLAEVLGATTINKGKATIGAIPKGRAQSINYQIPLKIRDLLMPDSDKQDSRSYQSRFYAYAWLFTHYLQISSLRENPHLKQQTSDFLLRYNDGEDLIAAFEASFGMSTEEMDLAVKKYSEQRQITVLTIDVPKYEGDIVEAALSPGEQSFLLADMAWRAGEEDVALDYFKDMNVEDPSFARALSLAAILENHAENIDLAKSYATQALQLAPDDSQVLSNYAHWVMDNRLRLEKSESDVSALIDEQVRFSEQAIAIDGSNYEAFSFLWLGQIARGDDVEALKTMMSAYQLDPTSVAINLTVANHLMALQRADLAVPFFERVMSWSHSEEQRQRIKTLLERIEASTTQQTSQ